MFMRNDRIRIVIADDEQNICEMLKRLIRFDDLGLELIGMVSNGRSEKRDRKKKSRIL